MYDITEQNRMKTRYLMDTYSTCTCMSIAINKAGQMLVHGSFIACTSLLVLKTQMDPFHKEQVHSSQAVCMDGRHKWRLANCKLSSLCCYFSDLMLQISSSKIILLIFIGSKQEPNIHAFTL